MAALVRGIDFDDARELGRRLCLLWVVCAGARPCAGGADSRGRGAGGFSDWNGWSGAGSAGWELREVVKAGVSADRATNLQVAKLRAQPPAVRTGRWRVRLGPRAYDPNVADAIVHLIAVCCSKQSSHLAGA